MVDYNLHIHMQEGGAIYLGRAVDIWLSSGHQTYNLHNTTKKHKIKKFDKSDKI